jgi:organic radical activating enzyme
MSEHANRLPVVELFPSIQGEGLYVGVRQLFVRFAGCNLDCAYCDTLAARTTDGAEWLSPDELAGRIVELSEREERYHSVCLTGGEPLIREAPLLALCRRLRLAGLIIYLETNGTLPESMLALAGLVDIVAMDVKLQSATGAPCPLDAHTEFLIAAGGNVFMKMVVTEETTETEIRRVCRALSDLDPCVACILQPATRPDGRIAIGGERLQALQRAATAWLPDTRVIPQCHKVLSVR